MEEKPQKGSGKDRIIVAVDVKTLDEARRIVDRFGEDVGGFKFGLEFLTALVVGIVLAENWENTAKYADRIRSLFRNVSDRLMWDGKFHDIKNTMAGAAGALMPIQPMYLTLHASAGKDGMRAVAEKCGVDTMALAVTVLTSLTEDDSEQIYGAPAREKVRSFAHMAVKAGIRGLVCSALEIEAIRSDPELAHLHLVVPGTRSEGVAKGDQNRIATPYEAILAGADKLVIGRQLTDPSASFDAVKRLVDEIDEALVKRAAV